MVHRLLGGFVLIAVLTCSPGLGQSGQEFGPACPLPFNAIAIRHSIDQICGVEGTGSAGTRAQSRVKNNFCAPGPPVDVEIADLIALQGAVEALTPPFPFGQNVLPPSDRSALRHLAEIAGSPVGEGTQVRLVAFVDFPHNAGQESVNCKLAAGDAHPSRADLHVEVVESPGDDVCQRVSIELIPHFRPRAWAEAAFEALKAARLPIRVTGQLMFDASHETCNQGGNFRASNWEIHPVYRVEVCKKLGAAGCSGWVDLNNFELPDPAGEEGAAPLAATATATAIRASAGLRPLSTTEMTSLADDPAEILAVIGVDGGARVHVVASAAEAVLRAVAGAATPRVPKGRLAFVLGWPADGEILGAEVLGYLTRP